MGRDIVANIITSIRNADMDKKGTVRIARTKITKRIVKIHLREGFIENVRKHRESTKCFWFQLRDIEGIGRGDIELF